jgi:ABC-type glutathione transport system ATPase component
MLLLNSLRKMVGRAASRKVRRPKVRPVGFRPSIEALEDRVVPSTFAVTTTADSGTGSLRAAIARANAMPDPDVIVFDPAVSSTSKVAPRRNGRGTQGIL